MARYAEATRGRRRASATTDGSLTVEVRDDGRGGADAAGGSGLRGLADRVAALDGTPRHRQPARRRARSCARRSHARRDRRGLGAAARGRRCACSTTPGSRSSARPATARTCCARSAPTSPTWRSSTSACRRPTPTRDCRRPRSIRAELPDIGVLVLSQYVEERYAVELLADGAEGVGYLLKDRIADVDALRRGGAARGRRRLGARPRGRRPHARRARERDDPLDDADPARARGARPDGRGPHQPRDRRRARTCPSARSSAT